MDYCTIHFGKRISDLNFIDIENFFVESREESDQIEFKSFNERDNLNQQLEPIIRTACAFLNSSGGIVIAGAPTGQEVEEKKEKVFLGSLSPTNHVLEKDRLISKISDSISPLPSELRVQILENESKYIFVLEVQSSEYAPHQFKDRYWMRIDGQTKPAPHHYIEALFKKVKYPNIEAFLKIIEIRDLHYFLQIDFEVYFFNWSPLINAEKLRYRMISVGGVFKSYQDGSDQRKFGMNGHEMIDNNLRDVMYYGEPIRVKDSLIFDTEELNRKDKKTLLILMFGSKFSPMKGNEYHLDLSRNFNKNPHRVITSKVENQTLIDGQISKGVSKEEMLRQILGER